MRKEGEGRGEGWIAGLQMAARSMQDDSDRHSFVTAFSGDDHYIADYLMEEVLQRQPVEFQHFLEQTSILDRLNASLNVAVILLLLGVSQSIPFPFPSMHVFYPEVAYGLIAVATLGISWCLYTQSYTCGCRDRNNS